MNGIDRGRLGLKLAAIISLGLIHVQPTDAQQAIYYVDPVHGNDKHNGLKTSTAFKTIDRARTVVESINTAMTGDIVVTLRGGAYPLTSSITFTSADSGTNGHNVIYTAYPGETPIISGGRTLSAWKLHDGVRNIWQAAVKKTDNFRQIYVNGVKAQRARSTEPLQGYAKTATGYSTTDTTLQYYKNQSAMEVVDEVAPWVQNRLPIAKIKGTNVTFQNPAWQTISQLGYGNPVWLENAYEFLADNDVPGQWYLNNTTHVLYYIPRSGETMNTAVVEVPVVDQLFLVAGSPASPVHNLQFQGLTFRLSNWLRPSTGDGLVAGQANQYFSPETGYPDAALDITAGQNILIQNCTFQQLGGDGINMVVGSFENTIDQCQFHDCAASAIQIARSYDDANLAVGDPAITSNIVVSNSTIHDVSTDYQEGCGIFVGYSAAITLANNELYNLPYSAISIGWGWGGGQTSWVTNHTIQANRIHDYMQVLVDGGGVYCNGTQQNGSITNNWIYNQGNPYGEIYLDDGSQDWTVTNNVCQGANATAGGQYAVYWYVYKGTDEIADSNYTDDPIVYAFDSDPSNTVTNTTTVADSLPPQPAVVTMNDAGPMNGGFVNDTDSHIVYSGPYWGYSTNRSYANDYQGDVHYTTVDGNSAQFAFTGTGIDWLTETNVDEGNVDFYLDGAYQHTVNCYSGTRLSQQVTYGVCGLAPGQHTLTLVKHGGTYLVVDGFVVHNGIPLVNDTYVFDGAVGISYGGTWPYSGGRGVPYSDFNADVHYSLNNGDYAQDTFMGTGIDFVTEIASNSGQIDVYLDGVYQRRIACSSGNSFGCQQVAYGIYGLPYGGHYLTLYKVDNSFMIVDGFLPH